MEEHAVSELPVRNDSIDSIDDIDDDENEQLLTRDAIRAVDDSKDRVVDVPEWGGKVRVKGLTGDEIDRFTASLEPKPGSNKSVNLKYARVKLVVMTCVDADGERVFTKNDIKWLGTKSSAALMRVFNVAQELAGLREDEIEGMVENFDGDLFEDSSSA